jgi:hypothetical protein
VQHQGCHLACRKTRQHAREVANTPIKHQGGCQQQHHLDAYVKLSPACLCELKGGPLHRPHRLRKAGVQLENNLCGSEKEGRCCIVLNRHPVSQRLHIDEKGTGCRCAAAAAGSGLIGTLGQLLCSQRQAAVGVELDLLLSGEHRGLGLRDRRLKRVRFFCCTFGTMCEMSSLLALRT